VGLQEPAHVTADKLRSLCDKLGSLQEGVLQHYGSLKHIKDELSKVLKDNTQRERIFQGGTIDCIALKSAVDSLNQDEITRVYQVLIPCEKLEVQKVQNIKNAVNELRKSHGDTDELRSIEKEVQVIESSFIDFNTALQRLEAHEAGMKKVRGNITAEGKKRKGPLESAQEKVGTLVEKAKGAFTRSEKTAPRRVQRKKQHGEQRSDVESTSEIITQHKDIVGKTVDEAHRDIDELSHEVGDLRKEAVDLYRQAIEKEVLAQEKAFEKAEALREQAQQLYEEANFLELQADELEQRSQEGV